MPDTHNIVMLYGAPGAGKTTLLARALVRDFIALKTRVLVFDPTHDVSRAIGARMGTDSPTHASYKLTSQAVEALRTREPHIACITPHTAEEYDRSLVGLRAFMAVPQPRWIYGCDESETVWPLHDRDSSAAIRVARNYGVRFYAAGKRPQDISIALRTCATDLCVFRLDSRRTVMSVADTGGEQEQYLAALKLKKGEYLYRPPFSEADKSLSVCNSLESPIPWPAD